MDLGAVDDEQLLEHQRTLAVRRRRLDAELARVAVEIARRSRRELGDAGLAQRLGMRTPDAAVMVRVGGITGIVADAVASGELSLDSADAILSIEAPELEERLIADAAALPPARTPVARRAPQPQTRLRPSRLAW